MFAGFVLFGSAVAFCCRGRWVEAGLAGAGILVLAGLWVCAQFAATKAMMLGTGRHRRRPTPLDAAMAALAAVTRAQMRG